MKVTNEIKVYELDNKGSFPGDDELCLLVKAHWNRDSMVVLEIGGHAYTVVAEELKKAINNATNV
jgi:hypothetical protein